jgi:predicted SAM-dependent methyltransferase
MHEMNEMLILQYQGKHKEAKAISDKMQMLGPKKILDDYGKNTQDIWIRHTYNRGWFLVYEGKYKEAGEALESGRLIETYGSPRLKTDAPIWNPKEHDIKGKSIIISLEGGYGDEIIHSRWATSYKNLGAKHVYLAASPEFVDIFSRIEGVDKVILRTEADTVEHDYWIPAFSAGYVAGHDFDNFPNEPYLSPSPEYVNKWKSIINSEKIKVGIRWAGSPLFEHQSYRIFPEKFLLNLSKYSELQIYSLQRDDNLIELPKEIIDLNEKMVDWEDTMAAIENLDIVITACTSIAHMAAAIGKETWIITPVLCYHTWAYKTPENRGSPYYKNIRLFRQKKAGQWKPPFELLYEELEEKFNLKHIEHNFEIKKYKKLNMGCGFKKIENFINADIDPLVEPDLLVDFNKFPWPFEDDEFDHIVAKDILEHLGNNSADIIPVLKEMNRISSNNALWEIQCPHWRCDNAINDPDHKRSITLEMFNMFNQPKSLDKIKTGWSDSLLAFQHDIDIETLNYNFHFTDSFKEEMTKRRLNPQQIDYALNTYNNIASSVVYILQIYKPGRINKKLLNKAVQERLSWPKLKIEPIKMD